MAYDLSLITSDTVARPPRIILLGGHKIGKSRWAAGAPGACFLPIKDEEGLDDIEAFKTPVCNTIHDVFSWLQTLREGNHGHQTCIIDSGTTIEPLIHEEACSRIGGENIILAGGGYGAGYKEAGRTWRLLIQWLDLLRSEKNMASIIIGHVKVKPFHDPKGESYDRYQWDIHDEASNILYRWADSILYCAKKVVVTHESKGFHKDNVKKRGHEIKPDARFLYTQERPSHPGGGRGPYGKLNYELSLGDGTPGAGWRIFEDAVTTASQLMNMTTHENQGVAHHE